MGQQFLQILEIEQQQALVAEHIPEFHRTGGKGGWLQSRQFAALTEHRLLLARCRQAGEVALHVGQQGGHTDSLGLLHQPLQGHRLASSGDAGDQAMAATASLSGV